VCAHVGYHESDHHVPAPNNEKAIIVVNIDGDKPTWNIHSEPLLELRVSRIRSYTNRR